VSLRIALHDAQGVELQPRSDLTYLHGGYGELLEALERALDGKAPGESIVLQLEPEQAFGEYDAALVRVEPAERYGDGLQIGMEVEEDSRFYTVTDIAAGKAVLDGNHPFAGMALRFSIEIITVRGATAEERQRGVSLPQG
jgi:FKBP-type peptidyl-prolyl cis-trans isomerase SlyD